MSFFKNIFIFPIMGEAGIPTGFWHICAYPAATPYRMFKLTYRGNWYLINHISRGCTFM